MRMNKEQRLLISKMVCEKVAEKIKNKHKQVFKDYKLSIKAHCYYNSNIFQIDLYNRDSDTIVSPEYTKLTKLLFKQKEYTVTLKGKHLNVTFTKKAKQQLSKIPDHRKKVEKEIDNFNEKMKTEFILQTSFNDINDIKDFVQEFVKSI